MKPSGTWSWGLGPYVKTSTRRARGRGARLPPRARPPPSWAPCCSTDVLLPPIYTYGPPNDQIRSQNPNSTAVTFCIHEIPSWGLFWSSAGGGIDHGGLLHQHHSLSDDVWVVYHRPSGPYLLARWLLLSFWISIQCSPPLLWRSIRCKLFLRCVCRDLMNYGFMIKFIYEKYLNLLWILLCVIKLSLQVSSNYQFGLAY